jgi:hypothetical protein
VVIIYAIINKVTKARYIGSTGREPEVRWRDHKRLLKRGTHHALPLQKAWNEYGERAFVFATVRAVTTPERKWAEQREIDLWVEQHGREMLYNGTLTVLPEPRTAPRGALVNA